jgi:hypothetical protein
MGFRGFRALKLNKQMRGSMKENEDWRNYWFVEKTIQQAQYMNKVNEAWIPHNVKDFCRYIASKATWRHTDAKKAYYPCFATHDTMEIQMNRSRDYVSDAKKKALELGWVQVLHRAGTSDLVWPRIGVEDEEIKRKKKRESWGRSELKPVG